MFTMFYQKPWLRINRKVNTRISPYFTMQLKLYKLDSSNQFGILHASLIDHILNVLYLKPLNFNISWKALEVHHVNLSLQSGLVSLHKYKLYFLKHTENELYVLCSIKKCCLYEHCTCLQTKDSILRNCYLHECVRDQMSSWTG